MQTMQHHRIPKSYPVCYDLPFGKSSQTAKRCMEDGTAEVMHNTPEISPEFTGSQDLFSTQILDTTLENTWSQGDSLFSPKTRTQLGMKCGRAVVRLGAKHKSMEREQKSDRKLPYNYVSIENIDLPHPKHLFKRKRRKQKESAKITKNVEDGYNAVHGHIQQLKVKLANRETPSVHGLSKPLFSNDQEVQVKGLNQDYKPSWYEYQQEVEENSLCFIYPTTKECSSPKQKKHKVTYESPTSKTWDKLDGSLYKRWLTGVKFDEE